MLKKICPICNKEFESYRNDKRCCSLRCKKIYHKKKNSPETGIRICKYCGKEYLYTHRQGNWLKNGGIGWERSDVCSIDFCCYTCGKKYNKEKAKHTKKEKYGNENYNNIEKIKQTCLDKYGTSCSLGNIEVKAKRNKTNRERYGVDYPLQSKEIHDKTIAVGNARGSYYEGNRKCLATRKKNGTLNTSKPEQEIKKLLLIKFQDLEFQYKEERYPFHCDFYVPSLDLFIEYQGFWSHGYKPFESTNEDLIRLEKMKKKAKKSKFWKQAIDVWTRRDVLKRQTAKKNNLNWIEFFNIKQFMEWYNNL